ncbi:fibroblast growth factor receptor-like 1 [Dendronephthya gigantea]|uniref:fibroblast growth factor receptor-like 1 n=1 Tax=Dendronephthya gigantea TaxID=151771 RepID=UPI00106D0A92|nr:fibroblast growth factor receptor-like 1 [Dendronephthya gigantea]
MLVKFCLILCGLFFLEVQSSGGKPKIVDKSTATYSAKVGERIRLKCDFHRWETGWQMTWYKDGEVISIRRKSRFRMRNGVTSMLRIKNVRIRDAGIYQCVARNKYGTESKQLNLTVTGQLKPRGVPGQGSPWFAKLRPVRQYIAWPASNDLRLRCAADGEPPLKYQWLKDGKVLTYRGLDPKVDGTK